MSAPVAWLGDTAISPDELLDRVGPGLAAAAGAAAIPAASWNAFAFRLGERLVATYARQSVAQAQLLQLAPTVLATVAGADRVLAQGERGFVSAIAIEATLRPATLLADSSAADLLQRIYVWGTRRIRKDRRLRDSLADLAAAAREVHAELAAVAGDDADAARDAERAAQLADAKRVLAGDAAALLT